MNIKIIFLVAERDLRLINQQKAFMTMRWIWFFVQVAVFGYALANLVSPSYYYYKEYYTIGIYVVTLYSSSITIAYEILEEAESGVVDYLLSLPITRKELELGRSIGGGLRGLIITLPPFITALYLVGIADPILLIEAGISIFLLSFGVAGLGITLASTLKSGDKTDIILGMMDAFIARLSTVFYPIQAITKSNPVYGILARVNPLTYAADVLRAALLVPQGIPLDPIMGIVILLAFAIGTTTLAILFYERNLEGGGWT
ncbi:MAG: ABC transporter permease [Thermoprotei archaeon]